MKREIKFRAWHKATKTMLNKWPYEWREGIYISNGEKHLFADNTFKFSEDKKECNRTTGKSVFISLDGFLCGLIPIDEETTRSINYSDEYDLMQFTGLLDKNGKEIYEGDILEINTKVNVSDNFFEEPCEVEQSITASIVFNNAICGFDLSIIEPDLHLKGYSLSEDLTDEYEVIGNIYQNPELLKL